MQHHTSAHMLADCDMTDFEAAKAVLAGELASFEILMRRYNNRLFRIARSVTSDSDEAMDIVQESWISVYQGLAGFKGPAGFASWVSRIAYNNALMRLRKQQRLDYQPEVDEQQAIYCNASIENASMPGEPADQIARQQLTLLLEQAIDRLPAIYRTVFMLRAVQQLSTQETADSLELDVDVVKQRFLRSKRMLSSKLDMHISQAGLTLFEFAGARCDAIVKRVFTQLSV